ncbi:MAG: low molecular weight phosphotyrosine protein phosphatase, partial [Fibrobacter sp.]|nr:low molecular weight phosphotyrosine protein phosphatase [Fibrobacter sp.]
MERTKILFVCHGNICRSPMAEFVMKDKLTRAGADDTGTKFTDLFEVASAATSTEEIGNPVYPPARRMLNAHGIDCSGKHARQMMAQDYDYYDYIV